MPVQPPSLPLPPRPQQGLGQLLAGVQPTPLHANAPPGAYQYEVPQSVQILQGISEFVKGVQRGNIREKERAEEAALKAIRLKMLGLKPESINDKKLAKLFKKAGWDFLDFEGETKGMAGTEKAPEDVQQQEQAQKQKGLLGRMLTGVGRGLGVVPPKPIPQGAGVYDFIRGLTERGQQYAQNLAQERQLESKRMKAEGSQLDNAMLAAKTLQQAMTGNPEAREQAYRLGLTEENDYTWFSFAMDELGYTDEQKAAVFADMFKLPIEQFKLNRDSLDFEQGFRSADLGLKLALNYPFAPKETAIQAMNSLLAGDEESYKAAMGKIESGMSAAELDRQYREWEKKMAEKGLSLQERRLLADQNMAALRYTADINAAEVARDKFVLDVFDTIIDNGGKRYMDAMRTYQIAKETGNQEAMASAAEDMKQAREEMAKAKYTIPGTDKTINLGANDLQVIIDNSLSGKLAGMVPFIGGWLQESLRADPYLARGVSEERLDTLFSQFGIEGPTEKVSFLQRLLFGGNLSAKEQEDVRAAILANLPEHIRERRKREAKFLPQRFRTEYQTGSRPPVPMQ